MMYEALLSAFLALTPVKPQAIANAANAKPITYSPTIPYNNNNSESTEQYLLKSANQGLSYKNLESLLIHMRSLNNDKRGMIDNLIAQGIRFGSDPSIIIKSELGDSISIIDEHFDTDLDKAYGYFQNLESKAQENSNYLISAKQALEDIITLETQNLLYFLTPDHGFIYTDSTNNTAISRYVNNVLLTYETDKVKEKVDKLKSHYNKLIRLINATDYSELGDQREVSELQADMRRIYYIAKWSLCLGVMRDDYDLARDYSELMNSLLSYMQAIEENYSGLSRIINSTTVDYLALLSDEKAELPLNYALMLRDLLTRFDKATLTNDTKTRIKVLDMLRDLSSFEPVKRALCKSRIYELLGLH